MNKKTKYYFIIKNTILLFILNILLGTISRIMNDSLDADDVYVSSIQTIISSVKVLLIITVILGSVYILFLLYNYYISRFYSDYKISAFEGIYHGFLDFYHIYDKVKNSSRVDGIQVDFKRSIISFSVGNKNYSLIFLDLFGKIEGKIDSEFWAVLSKPKKEYGRKTYTRKERFGNPYRVNANYIENLALKTNKEYLNYVVISGFYNIKNKDSKIIAPFEIIDILK